MRERQKKQRKKKTRYKKRVDKYFVVDYNYSGKGINIFCTKENNGSEI